MFVRCVLVVAASAAREVRASWLDSVRRRFKDPRSCCARETRLLLGEPCLDLLAFQNEWYEHRFPAALFFRGRLVGRKASESVAPIHHFFGGKEQEPILNQLEGTSCSRTRSPGPLEVESAEMAGHIDYFADEEQAGNFLALHGFRGEFAGVDAGGDFSLFISFGAGGVHSPIM